MNNKKESNPKQAMGGTKVPFSTMSQAVTAEVGLGMLEGARKYGRNNWRVAGARASTYYDATMRHLTDWWEGEDIDPYSGLSHVTKAICSLYVLRDAMINEKWTDDRPPVLPKGWMDELNKKVVEINEKYPDAVEPFTKESVKPEFPEMNFDVSSYIRKIFVDDIYWSSDTEGSLLYGGVNYEIQSDDRGAYMTCHQWKNSGVYIYWYWMSPDLIFAEKTLENSGKLYAKERESEIFRSLGEAIEYLNQKVSIK